MACGVCTAPWGRRAAEGRGGQSTPGGGGGSNSGGVPGLKGKLEPLCSWSDGKIKCTELLKTKLKAHHRVVYSHISVESAVGS